MVSLTLANCSPSLNVLSMISDVAVRRIDSDVGRERDGLKREIFDKKSPTGW